VNGLHERVAGLSHRKRRLLERIAAAQVPADHTRIPRRGPEEPVVLSFAQQRLWFLDEWHQGAAYVLSAALRVKGSLDVSALHRSLAAIVLRHEVLRMRFPSGDGKPSAVIAKTADIALPVIDLRDLGRARQRPMQRTLRAALSRRFALDAGPLFRAVLFRLGNRQHVLGLAMHHIVCDGWSIAVFTQELATLYAAFSSGQASPLRELPVQYADFARWQRQHMTGAILEGHLQYWRDQLGRDTRALELPVDRPYPAVRTLHGARHTFEIPQTLAIRVKASSEAQGVTPFMLLATGLMILLHRCTGALDVRVGCPVANRNRTELEPLIGCFVNTLVLRVLIRPDASLRELVQAVRTCAIGAYAHQDLPFETLVEELRPQRLLDHTPLFEVLFTFHASGATLELKGLQLEPVEIENRTARFDLALSISDRGSTFEGQFEYASDVWTGRTVGRLARQFGQVVAAVAEGGRLRVGEVRLLTAGEEAELRRAGTGAVVAESAGDVVAWVAAAAGRRRDAVAVEESGGGQLTYGAVVAAAAGLAAR
jgi:hypothetical protein